MVTHKHSCAKNGDVIAVQGNKGIIGYVIVDDPKAQGRPSEGGYNCRNATQAELDRANKNGTLRYE